MADNEIIIMDDICSQSLSMGDRSFPKPTIATTPSRQR